MKPPTSTVGLPCCGTWRRGRSNGAAWGAVSLSRSPEALRDLGSLDPEAIARVKSEAWPLIRDADELHDALLSQGALPAEEGKEWQREFEELRSTGRATQTEGTSGPPLWTATERWPLVRAVW